MPAIKKFIPTSVPITHKAVEGKPIIITKPIKNCKNATIKLIHQKYNVFLF